VVSIYVFLLAETACIAVNGIMALYNFVLLLGRVFCSGNRTPIPGDHAPATWYQ